MCFDERNTDRRGRPPPERRNDSLTRCLRRAFVILSLDMTAPILLLAFLAEDESVGVFHALALIGFRRAVAWDFGRYLADALAFVGGDCYRGRLRDRWRDALRDLVYHVVAGAERE